VFAAKSRIRLIRTAEGSTQIYTVNLSNIQKGNLPPTTCSRAALVYVPPGVMATIGYQLQALLFRSTSLRLR
jgi:hypothetical protein